METNVFLTFAGGLGTAHQSLDLSNLKDNWIPLLLLSWRGRRKIFFFFSPIENKRFRKLWKRRPESSEDLLWPPQAWNSLSNLEKQNIESPLVHFLSSFVGTYSSGSRLEKKPKPKKEANHRVEFIFSAPFIPRQLFIYPKSLSVIYPHPLLDFKHKSRQASSIKIHTVDNLSAIPRQLLMFCKAITAADVCGQSFLQHGAGE